MARIENGILGSFSGKVGEVVASSWNGIPYIKSRPTSFHDAKTPAQMAHRMKLQMAHRFVKSVKECVEIGFRQVAEHQSAYNKAVSYMMKNAMVGEYPSIHIEPSKVMLSQGDLAGVKECSASKNKKGEIVFFWDVNRLGEKDFLKENSETQSTLQVDDTAWLVAYNSLPRRNSTKCSVSLLKMYTRYSTTIKRQDKYLPIWHLMGNGKSLCYTWQMPMPRFPLYVTASRQSATCKVSSWRIST